MKKKIAVTILSAGLLGGMVADSPVRAAEPSEALKLAQQLNQAFVEVAESVSKSVVVVRVAQKPQADGAYGNPFRNSPFFDQLPEEYRKFFERQQKESEEETEPPTRQRSRKPVFNGRGSGLVYREDGIILTNSHVVENADKVQIVFQGGKEYDGEVLGVDRQSDIAVVKIDATGLTAAKMGDSDKTKVGEFAIAVGSPYELDYSVTVGHVSAKGRRVFSDQMMFDQDFIQTDASINPGNSGGPLIDLNGNLVGINTAVLRGSSGVSVEGIGFAVDVETAQQVALQLVELGHVRWAWMGVFLADLSPEVAAQVGLPIREGVIIQNTVVDGPSDRARIIPGDIVVKIAGQDIATVSDLTRLPKQEFSAGQQVEIEVFRVVNGDGSRKTLTLELGERPQQ